MKGRAGVVIDPVELDDNWVRRVLDGGIQILGLHPNPKASTPEQIAVWLQEDQNIRLLRFLTESGVDIEWEVHALSWLLPRKLFMTNPEWFRMDEKGSRTADHNLCCSNSEALETVSQNAAALARLMPSTTHRYHFWLDDVSHCRCLCPSCRGLSAADQAMKVYHAILQGIRRTDPLATQCYLAYHDTNELPESAVPDPGIFLEYAPFERDHHRALHDPSSEKNTAERKMLPALLRYFGTDGAQVLDYWLDNSLFSGWTLPPKEFAMERDVLRQDVQYYRQLGFETITTFACYLGPEYTALYPEPDDPVYFGKFLAEGDQMK